MTAEQGIKLLLSMMCMPVMVPVVTPVPELQDTAFRCHGK